MTVVATNNNKLDNHPIAKLVFGTLAGTDQENNRTLLGTARFARLGSKIVIWPKRDWQQR